MVVEFALKAALAQRSSSLETPSRPPTPRAHRPHPYLHTYYGCDWTDWLRVLGEAVDSCEAGCVFSGVSLRQTN